MSKKQRRKQSQKPARRPGQRAAAHQPRPAAQPIATQVPATPEALRRQRSVTTWAEYAERYQYVNSELKSIGILAGSFLVVLLILAAIMG